MVFVPIKLHTLLGPVIDDADIVVVVVESDLFEVILPPQPLFKLTLIVPELNELDTKTVIELVP